MGPHLCGHPVVQQAPCFPASTGPLRRRRRLTEAYRPLLINYDYTCGGIRICIHPTAPTEIHKYVVKWHISVHIISTLKGQGGSQRGEVSGALTDWLLGCLWRQHMWEECAGLVGFFLELISSKISGFTGLVEALMCWISTERNRRNLWSVIALN